MPEADCFVIFVGVEIVRSGLVGLLLPFSYYVVIFISNCYYYMRSDGDCR